MLNIEPSNLVRWKTYNSAFDEINHNIYKIKMVNC